MAMVKFSENAVRFLNYARVGRIATTDGEDIHLVPLCPVFDGDVFFMATQARTRTHTFRTPFSGLSTLFCGPPESDEGQEERNRTLAFCEYAVALLCTTSRQLHPLVCPPRVMELTRDTRESLQPCLLPVSPSPWQPWVATAVPIKESAGVVTAMRPARRLSTAGSSETGRWDTQSGQILLLDC
jgi:hypothetical protein